MLAASSDLIDLLHVHPFLVKGGEIQFNSSFRGRACTEFGHSFSVVAS